MTWLLIGVLLVSCLIVAFFWGKSNAKKQVTEEKLDHAKEKHQKASDAAARPTDDLSTSINSMRDNEL